MTHLAKTGRLEPDPCGRCVADAPRSFEIGLGRSAAGDSLVVVAARGHEVVNDTHAFYQGVFELLPGGDLRTIAFDGFLFDESGVEGFPVPLAIGLFLVLAPAMLVSRLAHWAIGRLSLQRRGT